MENFAEYQQPAEYDAEYGGFEPDGPFYAALAFVSRNPNLAHLFGDLKEELWHSFTDPQGRRVQVSGFQRYPDGTVRTTLLDLRYTFPQEMELLLHHAGLEPLRCYGDWDLSPLSAASPEMIYICRDPLGAPSASYRAEVPR